VWFCAGYHPEQDEDHRPVARKLFFPGKGWTDLEERSVRVPLDGRSGAAIPATLVVMKTESRRTAVLSSYPGGARSLARDFWYRALVLYNRLVYRRREGAVVRIGSPLDASAHASEADTGQTAFIRAFHPYPRRLAPLAMEGAP